MAMLLAPYNNSMRLGQGFNSFTQQICMNDAVTQGEKVPTPYLEEHQPKGISQIVSYSSRFVDKLSDVTDAMNVSASLSIKTGTIGGSVSGTYIDSDKFKTSDLNFFIQVKVTNQTHMARDYTKFQKLNNIPLTKFTEIYGDSFISGWEEGGELNALISVKVSDKSKTTTIKGALEAELGTPALSGAIKGEGSMEKSDINTSTETTISVNWSGGGQIKDPNVIWDINSLTLAAANFPDLVAMTPQRTYAILTKYTALKSFHEEMGFFSPLDYENAGIYTSALLDAYMDYKSIWKQIQIMNWEFESGTTALVKSEPDNELLEYAKECAAAMKPDTQDVIPVPAIDQVSEGSERSWDLELSKKDAFRPNILECEPYNASIVGLNKARRDCRLEMTKIVHEVDAVTDDPTIALRPDRAGIFLSPAIFKQLLPVKTAIKKDNGQLISPANEANSEPLPPIHPVSQADKMFPELKASIEKHTHRSKHYQMSNYLGDNLVKPNSVYFNDLDTIDKSWIPKSITVFFNANNIYGIKTTYTDDREILNGEEGMQFYCDTWDLFADEKVQNVRIESHRNRATNGITYIDSFGFSSNANIVAVAAPQAHKDHMRRIVEQAPAGEGWTLRGFYGSFNPSTGMQQLGVVWGNE